MSRAISRLKHSSLSFITLKTKPWRIPLLEQASRSYRDLYLAWMLQGHARDFMSKTWTSLSHSQVEPRESKVELLALARSMEKRGVGIVLGHSWLNKGFSPVGPFISLLQTQQLPNPYLSTEIRGPEVTDALAINLHCTINIWQTNLSARSRWYTYRNFWRSCTQ